MLLWYNMSFSITDNSLMSNIQKLFSEKIEIFSAVDFSKVSVLTGIIKISLKVHFSREHFCSFKNYWKTYYIKLYFIILYKLYKEYTTSAFFQNVMQVRFPKLNVVSLCTMNIVPVHCACTHIWHLEIYTIHLQLDYLRWKLSHGYQPKKPHISHLLKKNNSYRKYMPDSQELF